jgi:methionyl-tRNA formyltransferase
LRDNKVFMKNLRIIFMGTPEFAVPTLGSLLINGFDVVGVVTAPDKPSGRGLKITKSAVKLCAEDNKLAPVMQPSNLKDPEFINLLRSLNADVFIVVAFRMLPEIVWKMPPLGTINLHASLLPDYRGAAPINHAIINGETLTGVSTFYIDEKIDTGNILLKEEVQINPWENAGELHDKLMKEGAKLVIKTITDIVDNKVHVTPQPKSSGHNDSLKLAPKIHPEDCIIDWNTDAAKIYNFIRGLSPYPCARSFFSNQFTRISFKIYECQPEIGKHFFMPGSVFSDGKNFIKFSCKDGFINITSLQIEGKKRLNTVEFLRGFKISEFIHQVNQQV